MLTFEINLIGNEIKIKRRRSRLIFNPHLFDVFTIKTQELSLLHTHMA